MSTKFIKILTKEPEGKVLKKNLIEKISEEDLELILKNYPDFFEQININGEFYWKFRYSKLIYFKSI